MSMRTGKKGTMADDRRDKFMKYTRDELERFLTERGVSVNNETHEELAEKVYWAEKLGMPVKPSPAPPAETGRADRSGKLELDGGLVRLPRPETLMDGWEDGSASLPYITRDNIDRFIEFADKETVALGKDLFQSGLVQTLQYHGISANISYSFVRAKVIPRAESTDQAFMTWVVLHREDGNICLSECGCSVGLQKACEHVIAILFAVVGVHEAEASQTTNSSTLQHEMQGLPLENDPTTCIDKPQRMQGISAANKVLPGDVTQTSLNESNLESRSHPNKHTNLLDADNQHRPAISGQPATIEKDVLPATDTPPSTSLHQDVDLEQDTHMEVRGSSIKTSHFHQEAVLYVECNTISMSSDEEAVEDFSGDDEQNEPQSNGTMTVHEDSETNATISEQDLNSDLAPAAELNQIQIDESMSPRHEGKRKTRGEINHQQMKKRRPVVVLEKLDKYIDTDLLLGPEDCRRLTISSEQDIRNRMDLQSRGKLQSISPNQDVSEPKRENKVDVTKDGDDGEVTLENSDRTSISTNMQERSYSVRTPYHTQAGECTLTLSRSNDQHLQIKKRSVVLLTKKDRCLAQSKLVENENSAADASSNQQDEGKEIKTKTNVETLQMEKCPGNPLSHLQASPVCQENFSTKSSAIFKSDQREDGSSDTSASANFVERMNGQKDDKKYEYQTVKEHNICQLCGKDFGKRKWDLKRHMRVHTGEKPFKCEECGKAFFDKKALKKHQSVHTHNPYLCKKCGRCFSQLVKYDDHIQLHNEGKLHACHICKKSFLQSAKLQRHLQTHSEEKLHKCEKCEIVYAEKRSLTQHLENMHGKRNVGPQKYKVCNKVENEDSAVDASSNQQDEGIQEIKTKTVVETLQMETCPENPLSHLQTSPVCQENFSTKSTLTFKSDQHEDGSSDTSASVIHVERTNGQKDDKKYNEYQTVKEHNMCQVCGKDFGKRKWDLKRHMRVHTGEKPFKCHECGQAFRSTRSLKDHMGKHSDVKFDCPVCGKAFLTTNGLYVHKKIHDEIRLKPYKCLKCDRAFWFKSGLSFHMKLHSEERSYMCEHCGKGFKTKGNLQEHFVTHNDKNIHKCPYCEKCYKFSQGLQRHIIVEHNAEMNHKIHKCNVCDKAFKVRSYLVKHMLFHAERTHECQYCGKKFATSTGLRTHVRTHTGEKPYKCKVCDYTCGDRGNLCKHERKHAGKKTS